MPRRIPHIPLPDGWPEFAKSALLHAVGLAHVAMTHVNSWCANSAIARVPRLPSRAVANAEVALLREELRIKDARLGRIPPRERPHYPPTERLAILLLRAARGWTAEMTALRFGVTPATIAAWMKRLDEQGEDALVQTVTPVNRFPPFLTVLVQALMAVCPTMGKVSIAQHLARAGLHISPSTAKRRVDETPPASPPTTRPRSKAASPGPPRTITAKRPNHVWNVDLTVVPTGTGFWTPWVPFALPPCWPFATWIAVVVTTSPAP